MHIYPFYNINIDFVVPNVASGRGKLTKNQTTHLWKQIPINFETFFFVL